MGDPIKGGAPRVQRGTGGVQADGPDPLSGRDPAHIIRRNGSAFNLGTMDAYDVSEAFDECVRLLRKPDTSAAFKTELADTLQRILNHQGAVGKLIAHRDDASNGLADHPYQGGPRSDYIKSGRQQLQGDVDVL